MLTMCSEIKTPAISLVVSVPTEKTALLEEPQNSAVPESLITQCGVIEQTLDLDSQEVRPVIARMNRILLSAEKFTKCSRQEFSAEEQKIAIEMETYVAEGTPFYDHQDSSDSLEDVDLRTVESGREDDFFLVNSRILRLMALLDYVTQNRSPRSTTRYACNFFNLVCRNVASVLIPTLCRHMLADMAEDNLNHLHPEGQRQARMAIALVAASYPLLLNLLGAVTDNSEGTIKITSLTVRGLNLLIGMGAITAAYISGVLPGLAASLAAFDVFCFQRDVTELVITLDDDTVPELLPVAGTGLIYVVNQAGVNVGMTKLATPRGAVTSYLPVRPEQDNPVARAGLNLMGETANVLTGSALHALGRGKEVRFTLKTGLPDRSKFTSMLTDVHAGRTFLFTSAILTSAALASQFANAESAEENALFNDVLLSVFMGLFYGSYVATADHRCQIL